MSPFTLTRADSVQAYGELKLIAGIRRWLGAASPQSPFGIGDDCAVIPPTRYRQLVTTDPVIFGRHFDATVPARAVGAKLLKRNLSDIAAMGGRPVAAVISLALAPETRLRWLQEFYQGLARTARQYRVKIVGGDITEGPSGFVGAFLTLHGESHRGRVVTRTGARAGDKIYVTGVLGGSLAGHHFKFQPRLAEGAWLAGQPAVRAMMDVSDGLAKDIDALTTPGLAAALDGAAIPISAAARARAQKSGLEPFQHALGDGEDYELLIVVRAKSDHAAFVRGWRRCFPGVRLTHVGRFVRRGQAVPAALNLQAYHGYEHLR